MTFDDQQARTAELHDLAHTLRDASARQPRAHNEHDPLLSSARTQTMSGADIRDIVAVMGLIQAHEAEVARHRRQLRALRRGNILLLALTVLTAGVTGWTAWWLLYLLQSFDGSIPRPPLLPL